MALNGSNELSGQWSLLVGAAIGLTAGISATLFYSLGAFIPALESEFGWDRGNISLAAMAFTLAIFLGGVPVGRLCDRYGAAAVGATSLLLYAAGLVGMSFSVDRIEFLWIGYFVVALLGAGTTPIVMIRPVVSAFDRHRGLAMGIALTGIGFAGFWVPQFVTTLTEAQGWRAGYLGLAGVATIAAPIVWITFHRVGSGGGTRVAAATAGTEWNEAIRQRQFWVLTAMTALMALGVGGIVVHLVPLFRDAGASAVEAAATASILGLASVAGRLLVGGLLDLINPRVVTLGVLTLAATGAMLIWGGGLSLAVPAVILLGFAAGAEVDLISYLTSRCFGARAYSSLYGWQYSIFALGFGIAPFFVGRLRDLLHSYDVALLCGASLVLFAGLLSLSLGKFRYTAAPR